jgi:cysteine desulfurase/selenocysteine lyase
VKRRYFDNAATSFPKPPDVLRAMREYCESVGASAGRGAYREALQAGRIVEEARGAVRRLFGCRASDHVVFTLNGTDALNLALKGVLKPGAHVVTTALDHNSVLRPLSALERRLGVTWTVVEPDAGSGAVTPNAVADALRPETALVVVNHASNVTGALQPIEAIAELCRRRGVLLAVDAAQTAGHVPIDFPESSIDLLAFPGHKGLLGPSGTGVLLIREEIADALDTVREGGTGSASELPVQPRDLPDRLEAGSHNLVGLAGLRAGAEWILSRGVPALREHERALMRRLMTQLDGLPGLTWYGPRDATQRVGVFSMRIDGLEPADLSAALERSGILTRSGLHCAPFAHRSIGTHDRGGTTRLSLGVFHSPQDVDAAAAALHGILAGLHQLA